MDSNSSMRKAGWVASAMRAHSRSILSWSVDASRVGVAGRHGSFFDVHAWTSTQGPANGSAAYGSVRYGVAGDGSATAFVTSPGLASMQCKSLVLLCLAA